MINMPLDNDDNIVKEAINKVTKTSIIKLLPTFIIYSTSLV